MYVPRHGDIVWIDFEPHAGHEQAKERPALVLSEEIYNRRLWLAIMCPITTSRKVNFFRALCTCRPYGVKEGEVTNLACRNKKWFELTAESRVIAV